MKEVDSVGKHEWVDELRKKGRFSLKLTSHEIQMREKMDHNIDNLMFRTGSKKNTVKYSTDGTINLVRSQGANKT
jgi:hypothetical protein